MTILPMVTESVNQKKGSIAMQNNIHRIKKIINEQTLLVTVDIGKFKNAGYLRCPDGTEMKPFEFSNNSSGFDQFYRTVQWWKNRKKLKHVVVGVESTGSYAQPLLHYLKPKNVKLVQVNTFHTKRVKEVFDNSPGKTDQKDPQVMADIIELGRFLTVVIPTGTAAKLRELTHNREAYLHDMMTLLNRLNNQIYRVFPEFEQVMKNLSTKTSRHLLRHYPSPEAVMELGLQRLTEVMKKQSHGKINSERAKQLYQAAKQSVGVKEGSDVTLRNIHAILKQIDLLQSIVDDCELTISVELKSIPYSQSILRIKGVGEITTAGLIGEIADFDQFRTIAELEKYAGLNLFEISSGKHKGRKRISKRGRHLLRKLLYFACLSMIRKGGIFHEKYQHMIERGMPGTKALVAMSRKLLRIIFAMVRDHREFNLEYVKASSLQKAA